MPSYPLIPNGAGGTSVWKTDASVIHKLRLRCRYLGGTQVETSTRPASSLPPADVLPLNDDGHTPLTGVHLTFDRQISASLPSSPVHTRATSSSRLKPPRMRSMLVNRHPADRKCLDWASELDLCHDVKLSTSLRTLVLEGGGKLARRHMKTDGTTCSLLRHIYDLLESSGVRPELLVDVLHRRGVVSDQTVAAVRRCVARGAAYQLIAEVVVSKTEVEALCEGLQTTGYSDVADCLAAVNSLLQLRGPDSVSPTSLSTITCNDRLFKETSRDCIGRCTTVDETQTGNSRMRSSVNVDVVQINPFTGDTVGVGSGMDAASAARDNCLRHRSLLIDPETLSLSPQSLGPVACVDADKDRLPVASVTFHRVCLSDGLADRLADILLRHRSFRILTFVKCHRVDACLLRMRQTLVERNRKCNAGSSLSRLHVRLSRIDNVNVVAESVEVLAHSLQSLSFTGCSIISTGCAAVVRSLVARSRYLLELDLGFNDVADVGSLSDALATNCSLRRLRLRGNAIGSSGATLLFDSLRRNYRLQLLDISGNPIGDPQKSSHRALWCTVAESLLSNRTLRELKLEGCSLGVEACSALSRALAANTTLRVLDVSMNQSIGDLGVSLLADGLRCNRRCGIRTLALNMCAVGNVGFRSLLVAIKDGSPTGLRHVKLCYNRIGSKAQMQQVRRRGPGSTNSGRGLGLLSRPRPASVHVEFLFQEVSNLLPESYRRGGTLAPDWKISSDRESSQAVSSSTPLRRQPTSVTDHRPRSSIVMSHNFLVETADQNKSLMTPKNLVTSDCDARLAESENTTQAAVFNQANHRPVLLSTQTPSQQLMADVDDICNCSAVKEMPTTNDGDSGHAQLVRNASSVAERRSLVNCEEVTPTWLDRRQLRTLTTDNCDVEDSTVSIYALLCDVLRANPQLKVLLWGNQQWYSAFGGAARTAELNDSIAETVVDSSEEPCSVDESTSSIGLDLSRTFACNKEFAPRFI